jgi:hypothetical protein
MHQLYARERERERERERDEEEEAMRGGMLSESHITLSSPLLVKMASVLLLLSSLLLPLCFVLSI